MADAAPDSRPTAPVVPRHKLPERYALAAVREEAFATGTTPPPGVSLDDGDTHRGRAAGFEAASLALRSHRRLSDSVDMLRRLMENPEFKTNALRFVDVLPALADDSALVGHIREYFGEEGLPGPEERLARN